MFLKDRSQIIMVVLIICLFLGSMMASHSVSSDPFLNPGLFLVDIENHNFFEQESEEDLFGSIDYPRKMEVRVGSRSGSKMFDPPVIFLGPILPRPINIKRPG
jgi:hypothetical protein